MFDVDDLKAEIARAEDWYDQNQPECPKRYRTTILKVTVTKDEVKEPGPGVQLYVKGLGTGLIMSAIPKDDGTTTLFVRFNVVAMKKLLTKLSRPT